MRLFSVLVMVGMTLVGVAGPAGGADLLEPGPGDAIVIEREEAAPDQAIEQAPAPARRPAGPIAAPVAKLTELQFGTATGYRTKGSTFGAYAWSVVPAEAGGDNVWELSLADGEPAVLIAYPKPYVLTFVAAQIEGGEIKIATASVWANQDVDPDDDDDDQDDDQDDDDGNDDDDPPDDLVELWAKWTERTVAARIPAAGRADPANRLAGALERVAAMADFPTTRDLRERCRQECHKALGEGSETEKVWAAWSNEDLEPELQRLHGEQKLTTQTSYKRIYRGLARGLRRLAAADLRKPTTAARRTPVKAPAYPDWPASTSPYFDWRRWATSPRCLNCPQ